MKTITQSLSETCALVQVSFTRFNPVIQRHDLAERYARDNGAERKTTRLSVNILDKTDCPSFGQIAKFDGAIRNQTIYPWTTPTRVNGVRLTTNKVLPRLKEALDKHREAREELVRTFALEEYPEAVKSAPERLGGLYRSWDFPSPHTVMDHYRMITRFTALSDATPNIVGLPKDVLKMIEEETKHEHDDLRDLAFNQIVDKLHEQLIYAAESLEEYQVVEEFDPKQNKTVTKRYNPFRDSLMSNLYDRAEQAVLLDITKNDDIGNIAKDILALLKGDIVNVRKLRELAGLRKTTAQEMRLFIKRMEDAGLVERPHAPEVDHLYDAAEGLLY